MYENLEAPVKPYRRAKPNEMLRKERKEHFEKVQRNSVDFFGAKGTNCPQVFLYQDTTGGTQLWK